MDIAPLRVAGGLTGTGLTDCARAPVCAISYGQEMKRTGVPRLDPILMVCGLRGTAVRSRVIESTNLFSFFATPEVPHHPPFGQHTATRATPGETARPGHTTRTQRHTAPHVRRATLRQSRSSSSSRRTRSRRPAAPASVRVSALASQDLTLRNAAPPPHQSSSSRVAASHHRVRAEHIEIHMKCDRGRRE